MVKQRRRDIAALLILLSLLLTITWPVNGAQSPFADALSIVDMHAHFFQISPASVVSAMDRERIAKAVFMPVPNAGRSRRRGATDEFYREAAYAFPARLVAFYGGNELNQQLSNTLPSSVSAEMKARLQKSVEAVLRKGGFKGIGELGPRHIAWAPGMREIEYPADHPLMLALSDIAAKFDIPTDIHMEATAKTIAELERLLAHNPKTKIIWEHAGWSNTGLATSEAIASLMRRYPNLFSSIKYREVKTETQAQIRLLDRNGTLAPAWKSLFEEFSTKFFVGTDVKLGEEDKDYRIARDYRKILGQISEPSAKNIASQNANNILKLR
jgi:amidohydrolase family protein